MGMNNGDGLLHRLWMNKYSILVALALFVVAAYFFIQSSNSATQLSQERSAYNALNGTYNNLSAEHSSLIASNDNLTRRYADLNDSYNNLSTGDQSLRSAYDSLNGTITRFRENGSSAIALYYTVYQTGTKDDARLIVDTVVYNVGDRKADSFTIKCRVIYAGTPSVAQQTFTNVDPLDKRHYKFEFLNNTELNSVWIG